MECENPRRTRGLDGGRYRTRTDDLFRVKEARYQLRQSPLWSCSCTVAQIKSIPDPVGANRHGERSGVADAGAERGHARGLDAVWHSGEPGLMFIKCPGRRERNADVAQLVAHHLAKVRVASSSLVIRSSAGAPSGVSACGFESTSRWRGREARHRPAKPFTRVRIPSPPLCTIE